MLQSLESTRRASTVASSMQVHSVAETLVSRYPYDIKVAVMGCVVNGPGEAKEADLGIAGGVGCGVIIKKGEIIRKLPEEELLAGLKEELDNWQA